MKIKKKYRAINENVQDIFYFMYISTITSQVYTNQPIVLLSYLQLDYLPNHYSNSSKKNYSIGSKNKKLNMSYNELLNTKKFMCLLTCPCTRLCTIFYLRSLGKTPNYAEKLPPDEAEEYVDQLQGTALKP